MRLPENAFIQNDSQTMPSLLRAVDRNPSVSSTKREPMARSDPDSISSTRLGMQRASCWPSPSNWMSTS